VIVDTHAHLNHEDLCAEVEGVLERAAASGVGAVLVVGYDLPSSRRAVELCRRHPRLRAAVGLHPYEAARAGEAELRGIEELSREPEVAAIGEIGLDFHWEEAAPAPLQEELVLRQLAVAEAAGKPVVLHLRDAGVGIVPLLDRHPAVRPVLHCFDGDADLLREGLARGAFVSFAGNVTYKRNDALRALARQVPDDRLLVETDSPYLAPQGHRGRRNEPAFIVETLAALAAARGVPEAELADRTARNAVAAFPAFEGLV